MNGSVQSGIGPRPVESRVGVGESLVSRGHRLGRAVRLDSEENREESSRQRPEVCCWLSHRRAGGSGAIG